MPPLWFLLLPLVYQFERVSNIEWYNILPHRLKTRILFPLHDARGTLPHQNMTKHEDGSNANQITSLLQDILQQHGTSNEEQREVWDDFFTRLPPQTTRRGQTTTRTLRAESDYHSFPHEQSGMQHAGGGGSQPPGTSREQILQILVRALEVCKEEQDDRCYDSSLNLEDSQEANIAVVSVPSSATVITSNLLLVMSSSLFHDPSQFPLNGDPPSPFPPSCRDR